MSSTSEAALSNRHVPRAVGPWHDFVLSYPQSVDANQDVTPALNRAFLLHMANMRSKPTLDVDLVGHCNLNCVSCCHFSPISQPSFLALEDYERDLALLSNIDGVEEFFDAICLMGGEPLLHPNLAQFVGATRRHLPSMTIRVVTNGLLVEQAPADLWETMRDTKAQMLITPYPVGVDYERIASFVIEQGVKGVVGGGLTLDKDGGAFFLRTPLDPNGLANPVEAFVSCPLAGTIMQLRDGRIYSCNKGALFDKLNARFGTRFEREAEDSLELSRIRSAADIDAFRRTPKPMCRYCTQAHTRRVAWTTSACAEEEWIATRE